MVTAASPGTVYTPGPWTVPSSTTPGLAYMVSIDPQTALFVCACLDHQYRQRDCKHIRQIQGRLGLRPRVTALPPAA